MNSFNSHTNKKAYVSFVSFTSGMRLNVECRGPVLVVPLQYNIEFDQCHANWNFLTPKTNNDKKGKKLKQESKTKSIDLCLIR